MARSPNVIALTCPGCGSNSIGVSGVCEYCNTRIILAEAVALPSAHLFTRHSRAATLHQEEISDLQNELHFLEAQLIETGHPSLPIKIEAAKKKLNKLKKQGKNYGQ